MLVLSRKAGESIQVGDAVITIIKCRGGRAKIGIQAPPHHRIRRTELTVDTWQGLQQTDVDAERSVA